MKTVIPIVAGLVLIAGLLVLASFYRPGEKKYAGPEVEVCVLYQTPTEINPQEFSTFLQEEWGVPAKCFEDPNGTVAAHKLKTYTVTSGQHVVTIRRFHLPLSKRSIEPVLTSADANQKSFVTAHQAFAVVRYTKGPPNTMERFRFFAQVLLTLLNDPGAIGYADDPAQLFRSKASAQSLARANPYDVSQTYLFPQEAIKKKDDKTYLDAITLCRLFTTIHTGKTGDYFWLHIHGMEQFQLPDFLVQYRGPDKKDDTFREVLINGAVYGLVNDPINHGQAVQLGDDGVVYSAKKIRPEPDHPYGRCGVLELTHK